MKTTRIVTHDCTTFFAFRLWRLVLPVVIGLGLMAPRLLAVGTWAPLANTAPGPVNMILLLSDGTVMAQGYSSNKWYKLTPDSQGHYVNGTWTNRSSMSSIRLFFATQVLTNGRVLVAGAEHPSPNGPGRNTSELYDPVNDNWSNIAVPSAISDTTRVSPFSPYATSTFNQELGSPSSVMLPDGTVLLAPEFPRVLGGTIIYNPANNTFTNGPTMLGNAYEGTWLKLPDNSILTVDDALNNPGSTNSERYIPSLNRWIKDANVPVQLFSGTAGNNGNETGPALLLPSGKALFFGATSNTAIYTPSGNTNAGTWAAGPNMPNGLGVYDGPAAMLPNGKILCVGGSPIDFFTNAAGTLVNGSFFEYDPVGNSFTGMTSPNMLTNGPTFVWPGNGKTYTNYFATYHLVLLALPDGTVLCSRDNTNQLYVYQPDTGPLASSRPTILSITNTANRNYTLTGTLLNGVSQGASFGDDWEMDANFPLVQLTDASNNVYYARTFNWTSTSVMASNVPVSTSFVLPPGISNGVYSLQVTVCGNKSAPIPLNFTNDSLLVLPGPGLTFSGPQGGPFNPSSQFFTLTNAGTLALGFAVATNPVSWLRVSTNLGILNPGQAITNATVSLTGAATNLAIGTYAITIPFTNLFSGTVQLLPVTLTVQPIVQNGDFETGDFTYWLLNSDPTYSFVDWLYLSPDYVYTGFYGAALTQNGSTGTLSQSVVVNSNQPYLLSFWLSVPVASSNNQFTVAWNGTNLFSQSNLGAFGWVNFQFLVSSPVNTNLLQFAFRSDTGYFALDNISMTPVNLASNPPVIVSQPANQAVMAGQSAAFAVGAVGALPLAYQWALGGTNLAGATNAVLTLVATTSAAGIYSVTVTNKFGRATSSGALLVVQPASIVSNGSFGTGDFTGWTLTSNGTSIGSVRTNFALFSGGAYGALLGNTNSIGALLQFLPTTFGQRYLIYFRLSNTSGYPTNIFNVYWNGAPLLNQTNLGAFPPTTVLLLATAPSMLTQLQFTFQNDYGYFGLDDISVVPFNGPVLRDVAWSQNSISFDFDTLSGVNYQLQYTTDLLSGAWTNLGNAYAGDGSTVTAVNTPTTDSHRFYRILLTVLAPDEDAGDDAE
jgi:hypothetical protein